MELTGQKRAFADAVVSAWPERISNREAALKIGCTEGSASASGSRCMADAAVRHYIETHCPGFFGGSSGLVKESVKEEAKPSKTVKQSAQPLFTVDDITNWIANSHDEAELAAIAAVLKTKQPDTAVDGEALIAAVKQLDVKSSVFINIVRLVCEKLQTSTDPIDQWDALMISPWSTNKERKDAADSKAKFTMPKPAAKTAKEMQQEKAQADREARRARNAVGDFSSQTEPAAAPSEPEYKSSVPRWN